MKQVATLTLAVAAVAGCSSEPHDRQSGPGSRLFVPCGPEQVAYCVDVFAPAGERRLTVLMEGVDLDPQWQIADAGHVDGSVRDRTNWEWQIVRYDVAMTPSPPVGDGS